MGIDMRVTTDFFHITSVNTEKVQNIHLNFLLHFTNNSAVHFSLGAYVELTKTQDPFHLPLKMFLNSAESQSSSIQVPFFFFFATNKNITSTLSLQLLKVSFAPAYILSFIPTGLSSYIQLITKYLPFQTTCLQLMHN